MCLHLHTHTGTLVYTHQHTPTPTHTREILRDPVSRSSVLPGPLSGLPLGPEQSPSIRDEVHFDHSKKNLGAEGGSGGEGDTETGSSGGGARAQLDRSGAAEPRRAPLD